MENQVTFDSESNLDVTNVLFNNPAIQNYGLNASILNVSRDPSKTTKRYKQTNDVAVVNLLNRHGWKCTDYKQVKARNPEKSIFKPYIATFTNDSLESFSDEGKLTIVQRNSKDGTKCHEYHIGFLRVVCSNGLIVGESLFEPIRVKHIGDLPSTVLDLIGNVVQTCPDVYSRIEQMRNKTLDTSQAFDFAEQALKLRFGDQDLPTSPESILVARRQADVGSGLWEITNRVQENLIKAGNFLVKSTTGKTRKARSITNIDLTMKVNKGIWELAESFM